MILTERARAKINLTLRVLGRRADGYHEIESLVAFASLADELTLDTERSPGIEVTGRFARGIDGPNLIDTALKRLAAAEPRLRLGHVRLDKRLPVAAGIGGGSSDAAAALRAVRRANPELAPAIDWPAIAAGLGADVPVCLANCAAVLRGIGETIERLPGLASLDVVLVNALAPPPERKTATVFRAFDAPPVGPERRAKLRLGAIGDRARLIDTMRRTGNDLTAAACEVMPDIVAVMTALEKTPGVELVQLSGAGPTCFGVFPTGDSSLAGAAALRDAHPDWWVEPATIA